MKAWNNDIRKVQENIMRFPSCRPVVCYKAARVSVWISTTVMRLASLLFGATSTQWAELLVVIIDNYMENQQLHSLRFFSFWCFDHKIFLFYAEHVFWLFFNPNQVLLTIFGNSKVRKGFVNDASKGAFVVISWVIIRMLRWMLLTILWSQNPSIICWIWFLDIFHSLEGAVYHLQPFKGEERSGKWCV